MSLTPVDPAESLRHSTVPAVFGPGTLDRLGEEASGLGARRILLVTDRGIVGAGHAPRAEASLRAAGIETVVFDGVEENPTTAHVALGLAAARDGRIDFLVGLGGGSAMDCAKGVNFLLTNGGRMQDYWGVGKATRDMLPMVAVPTTAGTGSEAQSFALITDPATHQKMACGDRRALCRRAILDPELTRTMPRGVAAATGIDAVAHAVETSACNKRTDASRALSRAAWKLLAPSFATAVNEPANDAARTHMLLGAHLAGAAIERSMLGAAHACANPLTAQFGVVHGVAVGLMLPHVIRFNAEAGENPYADLDANATALAERVEAMLDAAGLPKRLRDVGVTADAVPALAESAAQQWTARFNPRALDARELIRIYEAAR